METEVDGRKINFWLEELVSICHKILVVGDETGEDVLWEKYFECYDLLRKHLFFKEDLLLSSYQGKQLEKWRQLVSQISKKLHRRRVKINKELRQINLTENYGRNKKRTIGRHRLSA